MDWVQSYLKNHRSALENIPSSDVMAIVNECCKALKTNKRIFVIGNGGSAANASHFVEDLGKGANDAVHENPLYKAGSTLFGSTVGYFRVLSLCDSVPFITAIGNDYCFEDIYLRQLRPLAEKDDVLIGISVSGKSPNLVKAFEWAHDEGGLRTISIVGMQGVGQGIHKLSDIGLNIQSQHYGIVEDSQMTILHMVCYYIMEQMQ